MKTKLFVTLAIILVVIVAAAYIVWHEKAVAPVQEEQIISGINSEVTLKIGQKGKVNDVFITFNGVTSDSRCPTGVQCIWAGEVKVEIRLQQGDKTETQTLSTNGPTLSFEGSTISITDVSPVKSQEAVTPDMYVVTFQVTK